MRLIQAALFATLAFISTTSSNAQAAPPTNQRPPVFSSFARIISFRELMSLSTTKRTEYIKNVRSLLVDIEAMQMNRGVYALESSERWNQYAMFLRSFIAEAEAQNPYENFRPHGTQRVRSQIPCPNPSYVPMAMGGRLGTPTMQIHLCRAQGPAVQGCLPNETAIRLNPDTGTFLCATIESFNRLPVELQARETNDPFRGRTSLTPFQREVRDRFRQNSVDHLTAFATRRAPTRPAPAAAATTAQPSAPGQPPSAVEIIGQPGGLRIARTDAPGTSPSLTPTVDRTRRRARSSESATASRTAGRSRSAPATGTERRSRTTPAAEADVTEHADQGQPASSTESTAAQTSTRASTDPLVPEPLEACANASEPNSAALSCTAQSVEEARPRFYARNTNSCVYGGNLRTYTRGRQRSCEPISEICIEEGNVNCRNPNNESQRYQPRFRCAQANQVICNPLVFGFKRTTTAGAANAYCVSRGPDATLRCDEASNPDRDPADPNHVNWLPQFVQGVNTSNPNPTQNYATTDPSGARPEDFRDLGFRTGNAPANGDAAALTADAQRGMQEYWDRFAGEMNAMCVSDEASRAFLCQECSIIRRRMVRMNVLANGNANNVCAAISQFVTQANAPQVAGQPAPPPPRAEPPVIVAIPTAVTPPTTAPAATGTTTR